MDFMIFTTTFCAYTNFQNYVKPTVRLCAYCCECVVEIGFVIRELSAGSPQLVPQTAEVGS